MPDRVGQKIGNYQLVRLLGRGGFAYVHLGEHLHLKNRQAAVKILHDKVSRTYEVQFLQEAQTIANLEHSHIVRILDFGIDPINTVPYLVMEYMKHGTLRDIYPKGSILPLEKIVSYVKQIANALQYAHDQRIIHRDVKPENFLVQDTVVVLSDFGIAVMQRDTTSQNSGGFAGTVMYSAPEQLEGKARDASDQYSLAIVVYEWLCGSVPFTGDFAQIITQHLTQLPQPLSQRVPIAPAIEAIVMQALAKEPEKRFESVRAFAERLEAEFLAAIAPTVISPKD